MADPTESRGSIQLTLLSSPPGWAYYQLPDLEQALITYSYKVDDAVWRWAHDDLRHGWPYPIILAAVKATRQDPPVPYSLAKVNQATLALDQLVKLKIDGVI